MKRNLKRTPSTEDFANPQSIELPILKKSRISDINNSELYKCTICLELCTSFGDHQICCLKCGHLFGYSCIYKWLDCKNGSRSHNCPQCNSIAKKKDIRIVHCNGIIVKDNYDEETTYKQLHNLKCQVQTKDMKIHQLLSEEQRMKQKLAHYDEELRIMKDQLKIFKKNQISSNCVVIEDWKKFSLHKEYPAAIMEPYYFENNIIYSSQNVIMSIDVERSVLKQKYNIHSNIVKDVRLNYSQPSTMLSVGLDKNINLTDLRSTTKIKKVSSSSKLWSCYWSNIDFNS